ncbi:MAG: hypothetical protein ONB17_01950 [candidate division KSB1 bacterium]|nr:hypothetical protein [candidate division KSB1 bacterium]MDZ7294470.1 hypothetical protein [candidate division KSB1 bacterium]MDZ7378062.1 hypothetical protein [candidate division KSB1 bacterium]MDZ7413800.1 hypothetical protein [candidate division KSB1 bacterium]
MPTRITPLDIQALSDPKEYEQGMKYYLGGRVKARLRTDTGLLATVKADGLWRVEVVVEGEQIFGRCGCSPVRGGLCRHQVATALAFLDRPQSFLSLQEMRRLIRKQDKSALVELLVNMAVVVPEVAAFFGEGDEAERLKEWIADLFDMPTGGGWSVEELLVPARLILQRALMLRVEGKWDQARRICFALLDAALALNDRKHGGVAYPESFMTALIDAYEGAALRDPELEQKRETVRQELQALLGHETAEVEGVYMEQLSQRLEGG